MPLSLLDIIMYTIISVALYTGTLINEMAPKLNQTEDQINLLELPDGYSTYIPKRWIKSDYSSLEKMKRQAISELGHSNLVHLLFPERKKGDYTGYPFITIEYEFIEKDIFKGINFESVVKYVESQGVVDAAHAEMEDIAGDSFDFIDWDGIYADYKNEILFVIASTGVPEYGIISSVQAFKTTDSGMLSVQLASLDESIENNVPAFFIIMKGIKRR